MTHTRQIFLYELRRNLRRPGYLFMTFGLPILGFVLLLGFQWWSSRSTPTEAPPDPMAGMNLEGIDQAGYIDETGRFADPGALEPVLTRYGDEAAARAALDAGEIDAYYIIPADYEATGQVTAVLERLNLTQLNSDLIRQLLLNTLTEGVEPQLVTRLLNPANFEHTNLALARGDAQADEDSSFLLVYVFAIVLMMSLFITNGYLMQSVIEEKETRLIEILISTVRPGQLLTGKIVAMAVLGLLQIVVWIAALGLLARLAAGDALGSALSALAVLANLQIPAELLPLLLIYFLLAYFLFAALFGMIGALSNSMREGPQYAAVFTLPAVLPLYFLQLFASAPDGPIPTLLSLFPLTAPIAMTQRLLVSDVPGWQIALSLVLLALAAAGAMWLAGRLFRVGTLLAGKVPRLRDLPRLVRG